MNYIQDVYFQNEFLDEELENLENWKYDFRKSIVKLLIRYRDVEEIPSCELAKELFNIMGENK